MAAIFIWKSESNGLKVLGSSLRLHMLLTCLKNNIFASGFKYYAGDGCIILIRHPLGIFLVWLKCVDGWHLDLEFIVV